MPLDIKDLRILTALQDSNSLVAAAERLHLTQSALSHKIRKLEEDFGLKLFARKSRPLRFTAGGKRLLALADQVLPAVDEAERDLARLGSGDFARLHIAIECHSCFEWLMPVMDRYRGRWPGVAMDLSQAFSFEALPALARGDVDLVITSDPQATAGIDYDPLFQYQALLALAPDHALARRRYIEPEDLADETLITYPVEPERLDVYAKFLEPAGVQPAHRRTAELTVMILQLVASGRGVAVLPDWALAEHLTRDYVAARPLTREGLWGTLFGAVRTEERQLPFIDDFLRAARGARRSVLRSGGTRPRETTREPRHSIPRSGSGPAD